MPDLEELPVASCQFPVADERPGARRLGMMNELATGNWQLATSKVGVR
jgi:hypothetical protein